LNINSQAILQKKVHVGTLQKFGEAEVKDVNTGQWHLEPTLNHEKVYVQTTKVILIILIFS
jgi:hypothetical protein